MKKQAISIRLDSDLLTWFKEQFPEGYQRGINSVLRHFARERQREITFMTGRAQQIFQQFHTQCFWHLRKDLQITPELIPLVQEGLRKYGGRDGYLLADELSIAKNWE